MYFGTLTNNSPYSSAEAPVNAGTYTVRFYLAPETNYELESDTVEANMTIERAAQTLDADPSIANRTTTTIAVNPVPGAEYSIDSGLNWQSTPKFSGLIPDTDYTVTMRLAETDNHKASNETSTRPAPLRILASNMRSTTRMRPSTSTVKLSRPATTIR